MRQKRPHRRIRRRGSILILIALATIPLLGMIAFAVDYGYLLKAQTDLQRCAGRCRIRRCIEPGTRFRRLSGFGGGSSPLLGNTQPSTLETVLLYSIVTS